jgi:uncharacterized protein (DUF1697 family)
MIFVALLRGVNVGGRTVKMDALKKAFEAAGHKNVKTILASGNVVFESSNVDAQKVKSDIEAQIKKTFGFDVDVILRSEKEIRALIKADPFKNIKVEAETRLYVTFLAEKPKSKIAAPYKTWDGDYKILLIKNNNVISTLASSPKHGTPDVMDLLGKEFGKQITTRTWNTILKIQTAME